MTLPGMLNVTFTTRDTRFHHDRSVFDTRVENVQKHCCWEIIGVKQSFLSHLDSRFAHVMTGLARSTRVNCRLPQQRRNSLQFVLVPRLLQKVLLNQNTETIDLEQDCFVTFM